MDISDIIQRKHVIANLAASSKRETLQALAKKSSHAVGVAEDVVLQALLKREELGSTGIGGGIAIPHARIPRLKEPYCLLARLKEAVSFEAIDGVRVDIVVLLLVPDGEVTSHVELLACIARQLRLKAVQDGIRQAGDADQIFAALLNDASPPTDTAR